ncbi:hypothetical protein EK0264_15110 [Epidermidibacterium keratini]|uniref:DUF4352 domain-containing protein n=1 Tax=Epidermidibacterium keratini TaxID=1891644 RepID=A0A7L4YSG7_9ACTN|nr:hypothetical protein [Epidermidibacterium keratini]QHC01487.1 hypothetical protein EK0264_15110 [Epidermidibacterium keratini]
MPAVTRKLATYAVPLAAVGLVLAGCGDSGGSSVEESGAATSYSEGGTSGPTEPALTGQLDCASTDLYAKTIDMGATVTCAGWTVRITDFKAETSLPSDVTFTDQFFQPVDPDTPVAAVTLELDTTGDSNPAGYSYFASRLIQGNFADSSAPTTDALVEPNEPSAATGSDCLADKKYPCTGIVYFPIIDGMDLTEGPVLVQLANLPNASPMGNVLVVP